MSIGFLIAAQRESYGRYTDAPTPDELTKFFYLNDDDLSQIMCCRSDHNRIGFALQLGALRLVVNMIVLWNTIYLKAALDQLRKEGYPVLEEDVARLSPLIHDHINMLGRYSFSMPEAVARGGLKPLRNPNHDEE